MIDYIDKVSNNLRGTDYKKFAAIVERMTILAKQQNIAIILTTKNLNKKETTCKNQL